MAVTVRIEPIAKDIDVLVGDLKSDAASQLLADFAADEIEDAKKTNASVLGRVPPYKIFVDGQQGASLKSVRPNGVIVADFELVSDVLIWISQQLTQHSPVKSGRYKRSHTLFADGKHVEVVDQLVPVAAEYIFINTVPYARKVERGSSSQAPEGVYQAVAALARARFGNIARTSYAFATLPGGERNPAIIVRTNA
jgi:hypothetical protein